TLERSALHSLPGQKSQAKRGVALQALTELDVENENKNPTCAKQQLSRAIHFAIPRSRIEANSCWTHLRVAVRPGSLTSFVVRRQSRVRSAIYYHRHLQCSSGPRIGPRQWPSVRR